VWVFLSAPTGHWVSVNQACSTELKPGQGCDQHDDFRYVNLVLTTLETAEYADIIDKSRIYVAGFAADGYFAQAVAICQADKIRGVWSSAAGLYEHFDFEVARCLVHWFVTVR
jgi:hypothetical protein